VFTSEEVWSTRYPEGGSVHLLEWPELPQVDADDGRWSRIREMRAGILGAIEPLRREKLLGSSLEADVEIKTYRSETTELLQGIDLDEIAIVSNVTVEQHEMHMSAEPSASTLSRGSENGFLFYENDNQVKALIAKTTKHKCGRCWRHLPEVDEDGDLCNRCQSVVNS